MISTVDQPYIFLSIVNIGAKGSRKFDCAPICSGMRYSPLYRAFNRDMKNAVLPWISQQNARTELNHSQGKVDIQVRSTYTGGQILSPEGIIENQKAAI
jgi:hypothetical protein